VLDKSDAYLKQCLTLYEQDMNEEAYHNRSGMDLWIGSDRIWYPELRMRSANVWDMTVFIIELTQGVLALPLVISCV
jgi:hypothetical protein